MIQRIKSELKIIGSNLFIISVVITGIIILLSIFAGNLLNLSDMGFEVIYPFYVAISIGEWGKTKADDNYDIIAAQSKSLFNWVVIRYITIFGVISLFGIIGMEAVSKIRNEMYLWELLLIYFPTALFLSSLSTFIGLQFSQEHITTLICGVVWIVVLLTRSLLRIPGIEYFYLFICYAGDQNGIWLINKSILFFISFAIWVATYWRCKNLNPYFD